MAAASASFHGRKSFVESRWLRVIRRVSLAPGGTD